MGKGLNIQSELARLIEVVSSEPTGLSIEGIRTLAGLAIDRRTLQRRLMALSRAGKIERRGKSKGMRYYPVQSTLATPQSQSDLFVPLSKSGAEILRLVRRPSTQRTPVGYNRAFLENYYPNQSSYLSPAEKTRLREISKMTQAGDQPAGTYAQRVFGRLLIDLSWNSSRLEGNTYSLLDTQRLIETGEAAEGKAAVDAQMILNHKAAIEFLVQSGEDTGFNRYTILSLHALLAENLLPDPTAAGRLRTIPVAIGQSVYYPPETPQILDECLDQILSTAQAIDNPFEQAFFMMVQLPYLQPFEDVNKRVSRLAANIPLIHKNLAPLSFIDVPDDTYTLGILGIYELNRIELLKDVFLWAYERSSARYAAIRQSIGEPDPFRLRYRQQLKIVVATVIKTPMTSKVAAKFIAKWATDNVPIADVPRFIEIAETELLGLHEGSFARFQVRPSEYQSWLAIWNN